MAARLVVVTGGKGGPGATTLAVGLAGVWADARRRVLLVPFSVVERRYFVCFRQCFQRRVAVVSWTVEPAVEDARREPCELEAAVGRPPARRAVLFEDLSCPTSIVPSTMLALVDWPQPEMSEDA